MEGLQIEIDRREVLRYLGYGRQDAGEDVKALIEECVIQLQTAALPKSIYRNYPLTFIPEENEGALDLTCFKTHSQNLWKNLLDCEQVILFAATLGTETDLLIHRCNILSVSKAVIMQAAAAAMIEAYCDIKNQQIREEYEAEGWFLRPRFSPGYGDFSLECQRDIAAALELPKRIGITLTDSFLMAPSKSVTAVIGVSKKPYRCERKGAKEASSIPLGERCEACEKTDCVYRRS